MPCKPNRPPLLILLSLALALTSLGARQAGDGWEPVAKGVDYRAFKLPGPVRAFVARMARADSTLTLDTAIARGSLLDGPEIVAQMAVRYDDSLSAWDGTWDARNEVLVAINGSFHDPETARPFGGLIQSGWYLRQYDPLGGASGLVWTRDRQIFLGGCLSTPEESQRLLNLTRGTSLHLDGLNRRGGNEVLLLTPQFDPFSPGGSGRIEALIEVTRPVGLQTEEGYVLGIVRQVRQAEGGIPIPFDHVVVTGRGEAAQAIAQSLQVDDIVGLSLSVRSYDEACRHPLEQGWPRAYAALSAGDILLRDGKIPSWDGLGPTTRHPRTAVCFNDEWIFFVVVDGRDDAYSRGMTLPQLASFCKDRLEASWGVNLDGGGSSTLWVKGQVKNQPSDGNPRAVANALMMVALHPIERSERFLPGSRVITKQATNVYLGPGTQFAAIASVEEGSPGMIAFHLNRLNGVYAKGSYWWRVDFGGLAGWVSDEGLGAAE